MVPLLNNPGQQIRFLELEFRFELGWHCDRLGLEVGRAFQQVRFGNTDRCVRASLLSDRYAVVGDQFRKTAVIDHLERVEFEDGGRKFSIFNVGHPGVGDVILLVVSFFCDLPALLLHITRAESKALAQSSEALSGTRTGLARIHQRGILRELLVRTQPRNYLIYSRALSSVPKISRLVAIAATLAIIPT